MGNIKDIVDKLLQGEPRALARAITLIEEQGETAKELLKSLFPKSGRAHVVGVTGSPGAGKSTLVDKLAVLLAESEKRVAILAIDPSSPFSGGALLGDRIRMDRSVEQERIYVRSMASRGALGGLSAATNDSILVLDAAGFDYIIVETVGVGQGEVEVVRSADTVVVVLVPGMGDTVQALKAGILEIADIFAINKADYDGADRLQKELRGMLELGEASSWSAPIVQTVATEGRGVEDLKAKIMEHLEFSINSGNRSKRTEQFLFSTLEAEISRQALAGIIAEGRKSGELDKTLEALKKKTIDPISAAEALVKKFRKKSV